MGRTKEEKCRLVPGFGAWHIGDIRVSDGPHGVRSQEDGAKNNDSYEATCFPTASGAACSWDPGLAGAMAEGIAAEARELGVSVVLGPGVNIKRSPLCGRNFEYYSEDPHLAGELAAGYIRAMQDKGIGTSLKHFAGNSQETHRMTSNSMIDERALHEIYLAAFETAVKKAHPATVMASYNYLNGMPACENKYLLTDILRNRWGYEGLVMSDWGACVDLPECVKAGMDVEMPDSNGNHFAGIMEAVDSGRLPMEKLDEAVARIDRLCADYPAAGRSGSGTKDNDKDKAVSRETRAKNHELAKRIEAESAVLLKNDSFLPIKDCKEVLLIGDLAAHPRIQGGGSSHINTECVDGFITCFEERGIRVRFARGYKADTFKRNTKLEKEALTALKQAVSDSIPVLFFGGLTDMAEGEGYDRESFDLPANQRALLEQVFTVTKDIGFISFGGSPYDMEMPSECRALLQLYLGGEAAASACTDILTGRINPSGKLAETVPFSEKDVPSYGYFAGQGKQSLHPDDVEYRESIFVGYRYYDTFNVPVRYCFGHGLSYTEFGYSDIRLKRDPDGHLSIVFSLENTGDMDGSEISQVYVCNPDTDAFRPARELRGFAKTYLKSGEKKEVEIALSDRAFCAYTDHEFKTIAGRYVIQVGASLNDIRLECDTEIEGVSLKCPFNIRRPIPLSDEDFGILYEHEKTSFSDTRPGGFSTKNSLAQLRPYSALARRWTFIGRLIARFMYPGKSASDPEVRMTLGGILEGNLDTICNQSGGIITPKTIAKIVDSANSSKANNLEV